ncbi:hypothetical protein AB7M29_004860 [Pseudomonas sp. F-14 TE3623]|uniref:HrpG protein n=1 Tax=Pseudomonas farris TaxID=2841207 RepID=A0ABS6PWT6_9PSED|nr:type III secretion system chaperone [Pseudomonas farris]MBV4464941.1 HrpG protein [Pseudomonas farris]
MKSAELIATVEGWLDSGDVELKLSIDHAPIKIQRRHNGLLCIAMLSVSWCGDDASLEAALSLCGPSLERFSGALALDPTERRLCLLLQLEFDCTATIIHALESLANQRDVWESMLDNTATPLPRRLNQSGSTGRLYV